MDGFSVARMPNGTGGNGENGESPVLATPAKKGKEPNALVFGGEPAWKRPMAIGFAVFPYLIGGIAMWFVAHQVAPVGRTISLFRAVMALVLTSCCCAVADHFLQPRIGDWRYLVDLVVSVFVVLVVFQLSFWRSVLAVVVYEAVFVAAGVVVGLVRL